jgi:hypothetical protein
VSGDRDVTVLAIGQNAFDFKDSLGEVLRGDVG